MSFKFVCIFFCVYSGKRHGKGEGLIFSFNSTQSTPNYFAAEHGFYTGGWKYNMRSDLHHLLMIFFQSVVVTCMMFLILRTFALPLLSGHSSFTKSEEN